jgi:hypothetical protein
MHAEYVSLGKFELGERPRKWALIDQLAAKVARLSEASPDRGLTARKFDLAQPAGHRVYIGAYSQLQSGWEHVEALRQLLQAQGSMPRAPWTLTRSIFESGFWATWILDPVDGLDRRRRALRMEVADHKQSKAFHRCFVMTSEERARMLEGEAKAEQSYRSDAAAVGLEWSLAGSRPNLIDELHRLNELRSMGRESEDVVEGVWRALSGMQHGFAYALLAGSDAKPIVQIPGGQKMQVSSRDETFQTMNTVACMLLMIGMNQFVRRCERTD